MWHVSKSSDLLTLGNFLMLAKWILTLINMDVKLI